MELTTDRNLTGHANVYDDNPVIFCGTHQVLAASSQLNDLRQRTGQQNDLSTDLLLILSRHDSYRRRLVLVLLTQSGVLSAAVIFAERCVFGWGVGLLRAGDQTGDGAVIAAQAERKTALLAAIHIVLRKRQCHTVAATLGGVSTSDLYVPQVPGLSTDSAVRTVRRWLPLGPSLNETLSRRFTPKKRKNLLYYYRALWKTYNVEFVPAIPSAEAEAALLQLSRHSWPHREAAEIAMHCDFLRRHPGSFCMGIRLKSGSWLSLLTGWRIHGVTYLPWQLNHEDYKSASLMQVMRTCLIEHECGLGQTALSWVGGTVSFQTACEPEFCLDVIQFRPSLVSMFFRHVVAPFLFSRNPSHFTDGSLTLFLTPRSRPSSTSRTANF